MSSVTPTEVEALVQKARALYPNSLLKISYYGNNDSPEGDDLQVSGEYVRDPDESLMDLAREIMWLGGADYNNEGGGGEIEIDTGKLTCTRREYNNIHSVKYEPEESWQVW